MFKVLLVINILFFCAACNMQYLLPDSMDGTSVNLSKKGLTNIPDEIFENKQIKTLKLYGNKLDSLPEKISKLENLEELYLGKNNLTTLPESIGDLKNLKLLSIQYNEIDILPESIGKLENLEQLILNQNRLITLPKSIGQLKKLENLRLNFNQIESIPAEIGDCEGLRFLYLNRNFIKSLPVEIANLTQLKELHIHQAGMLLDVPEEVCKMRYLEILEIDQSTAIPPCLLIIQTSRLQIIRH